MDFSENFIGQGRATGTIRKSYSVQNNAIPPQMVENNQNIGSAPISENDNFFPINYNPTVDLINKGVRVMVIMRGLPGSGKSFLAKEIHGKTVAGDPKNHIFSSDDFFIKNGYYIYVASRISDAHQYNQNRVLMKAQEGWSPIIVDNTNVKSWELHAYVRMGVANQYHIEIMEPCTTWSRKVGILANLNQHNVPVDTISRMVENWENTGLVYILRELGLDYKPPLLRNLPPLIVLQPNFNPEFSNTLDLLKPESNNWQNNWQTTQIENRPHNFQNFQSNDMNSSKQIQEPIKPMLNLLKPTTDPPPVVPTSTSSDTPQFDSIWESTIVEDASTKKKAKKSKQIPQQKSTKKLNSLPQIEMHKVGCLNENPNFTTIRELYPNIQAAYLFDLFEKCKGDADWTVNVLLEDNTEGGDNTQIPNDELICDCFVSDIAECLPTREIFQLPETPKRSKAQSHHSPIRKIIETSIQFGDNHYTDNMKKVRNWKQGIFDQDANEETILSSVDLEAASVNKNPPVLNEVNFEETSMKMYNFLNPREPNPNEVYDTASDDESSVGELCEVMEIDLGIKFVKALDEMFGGSSHKSEIEKNKKMSTKIFMTREMGHQLYTLWLESVYSQSEEEKIQRIKEDEELAKSLMENCNEYQKPSQSQQTNSLDDIMDMQMTLDSYQKQVKNNYQKNQRTDMATKMKQDKLLQLFPNVDMDTLMEIFTAHNYNLQDTVETLKLSLPSETNEKLALSGNELIAQAREEMRKVNSGQMDDNGWTTVGKNHKMPIAIQAATKMESAEKIEVLRNLEDLRETLEYHRNHRNVCLEKARCAIRDQRYDLGTYYSNVANLHKHKLEAYNLKVASCLATIHESTQSNPNMLDLHYMSLYEAVECLHMFLDKHIYKIKIGKIPYKDILIITGRGNNSVGGVSHIKHKTRAILKERGLGFKEINPGLLKVKIFSTSKMQSK